MFRKLIRYFPALAVALAVVTPAAAQERRRKRREHERLEAALFELREARTELMGTRDDFRGHRDKALAAMGDAVNTLKAVLRVKEDRDIRRMEDRGRAFYKEYRRYPHLHQAVKDLREAQKYLESSGGDFGGMKERALRDIRRAREELEAGLREERR